jgi:hypothetical protein
MKQEKWVYRGSKIFFVSTINRNLYDETEPLSFCAQRRKTFDSPPVNPFFLLLIERNGRRPEKHPFGLPRYTE